MGATLRRCSHRIQPHEKVSVGQMTPANRAVRSVGHRYALPSHGRLPRNLIHARHPCATPHRTSLIMTITPLEKDLFARANDICELCGADQTLQPFAVAPFEADTVEHTALLCATCREQIEGEDDALDPTHWFCLQEAIWSPVAPVQVLSYRLVRRLARKATWASDILAQAYLPDEVLAWAEEGINEPTDDAPRTLDSNGAELNK